MDTLKTNPSGGVSNQSSETNNSTQLCSCGSGKPQNDCCGNSSEQILKNLGDMTPFENNKHQVEVVK